MKKKALSVMFCISLGVSSVLGSMGMTAKAASTDKVIVEQDEVDSTIAICPAKPSETFYELKSRASEFNSSNLESSELKGVYGKIYNKIEEIYRSKKLNYSEDELKLRTNIYWLTVLEVDYDNDQVFKSAMEYLDFTFDDIVNILENGAGELFIDAEIELPKLNLYMILFDASKLSEEDKKLYDAIKIQIAKENKEYGDDEIEYTAMFLWAVRNMDLGKYGTQARIDILVDKGVTLENYIALKLARLEGTNAEIVKNIYESVLLRNIDGDGLKYWTDKLESLIESGKSQSEAVSIIVDQLKSGQEFKLLLTKFDVGPRVGV